MNWILSKFIAKLTLCATWLVIWLETLIEPLIELITTANHFQSLSCPCYDLSPTLMLLDLQLLPQWELVHYLIFLPRLAMIELLLSMQTIPIVFRFVTITIGKLAFSGVQKHGKKHCPTFADFAPHLEPISYHWHLNNTTYYYENNISIWFLLQAKKLNDNWVTTYSCCSYHNPLFDIFNSSPLL